MFVFDAESQNEVILPFPLPTSDLSQLMLSSHNG